MSTPICLRDCDFLLGRDAVSYYCRYCHPIAPYGIALDTNVQRNKVFRLAVPCDLISCQMPVALAHRAQGPLQWQCAVESVPNYDTQSGLPLQ